MSCMSVLATMNCTPRMPAAIIRFTAFPPPPPTPTTFRLGGVGPTSFSLISSIPTITMAVSLPARLEEILHPVPHPAGEAVQHRRLAVEHRRKPGLTVGEAIAQQAHPRGVHGRIDQLVQTRDVLRKAHAHRELQDVRAQLVGAGHETAAARDH